MKDRALVFATGYFGPDHGPRYEGWCRYYEALFAGDPIDLLIVADGHATLAFEPGGVDVLMMFPHLGRKGTTNYFPGFRRSFGRGVLAALEGGYRWLAHVESDCYIRPAAKVAFLAHLYGRDNAMAFCPRYGFPETALQVINRVEARTTLAKMFGPGSRATHDNSLFEFVMERAYRAVGGCVSMTIRGDRVEDHPLDPTWDFAAQATLAQVVEAWPDAKTLVAGPLE